MWASIAEIKATLGLASNLEDREGLRGELKERLHLLHPDKAGVNGKFADEATETAYHRVTAALQFLDEPTPPPGPAAGKGQNIALVPFDQVATLMERLIQARDHKPNEEARRREVLADARIAIRRASFVPKVTSGSVAAAIAAVWAFAENIDNNPIFGRFIDSRNPFFLLGSSCFFLAAGLVFVFVWRQERLREQRVEFLLSESGLRWLLQPIRSQFSFRRSELSLLIATHLRFGPRVRFESMEEVRYARSHVRSRFFDSMGLSRVSPAIIDEITDAQIDRLEARNAVTMKSGIDPEYVFK